MWNCVPFIIHFHNSIVFLMYPQQSTKLNLPYSSWRFTIIKIKLPYLLIDIAIITGCHPERRTSLICGLSRATTTHSGIRPKKMRHTRGDRYHISVGKDETCGDEKKITINKKKLQKHKNNLVSQQLATFSKMNILLDL